MSEAIDEPITEEAVARAEREGDDAEVIDGPDSPGIERSDADSARMIAQAERANKAYTAKLRGIFGADTPMYDCTTCDGLGVTFAPVEAAAGDVHLVHPDNLERCGACDGYGMVETGSRNPDHAATICIECQARGYITKQPALAAVPPYVPPAADLAQPLAGQWVPGKGFVPYGATEPVPGSLGA